MAKIVHISLHECSSSTIKQPLHELEWKAMFPQINEISSVKDLKTTNMYLANSNEICFDESLHRNKIL